MTHTSHSPAAGDRETGIRPERLAGIGAHPGNPAWFGELRQTPMNHWMVRQR